MTQWCPVFQGLLHLGAPQGWGWVCSELSVPLQDVSCCLDERREEWLYNPSSSPWVQRKAGRPEAWGSPQGLVCLLICVFCPWKTPSSRLNYHGGRVSFILNALFHQDAFTSEYIRSSPALLIFFIVVLSIQVTSCRILNCFSSNPFTADWFHYQPA